MKISSAKFITSSPSLADCPKGKLLEYAFIGRSNVGKSSLINTISGKKKLAKTSGKPGKTQLINHFLINDKWYLVDLPGYGWAQVSKTEKAKWEKMINEYLASAPQLACTFLLIDSRHEPQKNDLNFIQWLGENGIAFCIVFTKSDKLTPKKIKDNTEHYKKVLLETWEELPRIFTTSSVTSTGKDDLLNYIDELNKSIS